MSEIDPEVLEFDMSVVNRVHQLLRIGFHAKPTEIDLESDRLARSITARLLNAAQPAQEGVWISREVQERLIAFMKYMVESEWIQESSGRWDEADSLLSVLTGQNGGES